MLSGIIFDMGDTLIEHQSEFGPSFSWEILRPRMVQDLLLYLKGQLGAQFDSANFEKILQRELVRYDEMRNRTHQEQGFQSVLALALQLCNLPILSRIQLAQASRAYFEYSESLWQAMPFVHETLRDLQGRGFRLGLLSNAMDHCNVLRLLARFDLLQYFDPLYTSAGLGVRKPAANAFQPLLEYWHCAANQVAMVGDTLNADILGAREVGIYSIWLDVCADRPDNLKARAEITPDASISNLPALLPLLEKRRNLK